MMQQVDVINALKQDTMMLKYGPYSSWTQLSSGAHGILLMAALCDQVNFVQSIHIDETNWLQILKQKFPLIKKSRIGK